MRGLSLSSGRRLVLDGGLATQLESAGADLSGELWSARLLSEAPQEIKRAHDEFVLAGADVITTASYQCSVPLLMRVLGVDDETAAGLISKSVDIARSSASAAAEPTATAATAACRRVVLVAASIGPYGACLADGSEYNGHYKKLPVTDLVQWHQRRFDLLCDAKPDVLAFETIPCRNEIAALCSLLHQRPSARAWLSIACNSGTTLNSGELVADAIDDLERLDTHNQVRQSERFSYASKFLPSIEQYCLSATNCEPCNQCFFHCFRSRLSESTALLHNTLMRCSLSFSLILQDHALFTQTPGRIGTPLIGIGFQCHISTD